MFHFTKHFCNQIPLLLTNVIYLLLRHSSEHGSISTVSKLSPFRTEQSGCSDLAFIWPSPVLLTTTGTRLHSGHIWHEKKKYSTDSIKFIIFFICSESEKYSFRKINLFLQKAKNKSTLINSRLIRNFF